MSVPERNLSLGPLNIIDHHNGRYAMSVVRNAHLPAPFVYRTPSITAPDKATPRIDRLLDIDISTLPAVDGTHASAATLGEALTRLYVGLVAGVTDVRSATGSIQTVVSLSYPLRTGDDDFTLPPRRIPVVLDLPEPVPFHASAAEVAPMVTRLSDAIVHWRNRNAVPQDLLPRARLLFDLSVFSTLAETGLPIIRLHGLYLSCAAVAWP
jgi:hypothetical protein